MTWLNSLALWQWGLLAIVPPLVISLYFLKLKRQPLEVPSTYLWSRTIEDLHVNSIWQKLRQSLLLFLQLLALLFIAIALLRPGWKGTEFSQGRLIFLIDNSASMSTKDVGGKSRLEDAKRRVLTMIDEMEDEVAMVVTFSDDANAVQTFTGNRSVLKREIKEIKPTNRSTDPLLALRYASGLANPGRQANRPEDVQVAEALPASLYIYSDGGFPEVKDFSLGNLEPNYVAIGSESPHNLGITSFAAERNPEQPDQLQAFARVENGGAVDGELLVTLEFNGSLVDSQRYAVPAGEGVGATFNLPSDLDPGVLTVKLEKADGSGAYDDQMEYDNIAYAPINPPRRARVLLVSPDNDAWEMALSTERVLQIAETAIIGPSQIDTEAFVSQTSTGAFDLIIFDMCSPKEMPMCNTLFLGSKPPGDWKFEPFADPPFFLDSNRTHPLMQMVDMSGLLVAEGGNVIPPQGGRKLMEADQGTLLAIAPRRAYEDAVLGFGFFTYENGVAKEVITNWHRRPSFPVFVMNVVKYLGGSRGSLTMDSVKPGKELRLNSIAPVEQIRVETPDKETIDVFRESMGAFVFSHTTKQGVYQIYEGDGASEASQRFAVNLFDARESNVLPVAEVMIDHNKVTSSGGKQPVRRELWKWILLGVLALLTFEWYVFNQRVYV